MEVHRKIIVYIATSADGYIVRPDGDVAWLERPRPKGNYGMGEFFKSIDTILWGRKTYAKGIEMGMKASLFPSGTKNYVFSRGAADTLVCGVPPGVHFEIVSEPIQPSAQRLRAAPGKHIWMMGGGIIASFLGAGDIDEFRIHVLPVLIGEGIPLIAPRHRLVRLKLLAVETFPDGVVRLNYSVNRSSWPSKRTRAVPLHWPLTNPDGSGSGHSRQRKMRV